MIDTVLRTMADQQRRRTLVELHERGPDAELRVPDDVHCGTIDWEIRHAELIHHELPRMADAGYIAWDREKHVVTRGPEFDAVEPVLELFDEAGDELPMEWP